MTDQPNRSGVKKTNPNILQAPSVHNLVHHYSGADATRNRLVPCAIMSGLANQLFEVANVLVYARRHGCIPVFDTSVTESASMIRPQPTYWDTVFSRAVAFGDDLVFYNMNSCIPSVKRFADMALTLHAEGCSVIGGCCRVTPSDIRMLSDQFARIQNPSQNRVC